MNRGGTMKVRRNKVSKKKFEGQLGRAFGRDNLVIRHNIESGVKVTHYYYLKKNWRYNEVYIGSWIKGQGWVFTYADEYKLSKHKSHEKCKKTRHGKITITFKTNADRKSVYEVVNYMVAQLETLEDDMDFKVDNIETEVV